jgi:hypothetical protein
MRRLSSKLTFFNKRVFPTIWFGFLGMFLVVGLFGSKSKTVPLPFLIVPIFMAVLGYFTMKKLFFDLADEVWENGDHLVVKNKGVEERIAFTEIKHLNYSGASNPQRITLTLHVPNRLGSEISFSPIQTGFLSMLTKNKIATELIDKVDRARQR